MEFLPKFLRHAIDKCYTYALIKTSGLFDEEWYVQTYNDVLSSDMSPLKHFLKRGYKKGYNPSPKFSCVRYMSAYPMVIGANPLVHYLKKGRFRGYVCYGIYGEGKKKECKSSEEPQISVIVTSNNHDQYIAQALESVVSQIYKNIEVIVIDDGSKDKSVQAISEYVKTYSNVHLYQHPNQENRGLIASILFGIEKSKGQYIAFCESDDYWTQDYLEKKIQLINQYEDVTIISNDVELIGDEIDIGQRAEYMQAVAQLLRSGGNRIDVRHFQERNWIPTFSSVMIRADILKELDFSSPIPAWIDFWLYRQILKKHLLFYVDAKLTFWRQSDSYSSAISAVQQVTAQKSCAVFLSKSNRLIRIKTDHIKAPRCVKNSRLFDEKYYRALLKGDEDVQSLVNHYYTIGWKYGLNPSNFFDGDAYLSQATEVISMQLCPLFHYETYGKNEHRKYVSVDESNANSIKYEDINSIKRIRQEQKTALLVSHELSLTGAPRALFNLAKSLKKCGVYPVVVSRIDGELRKEIEESGIECKVVMALVSPIQNLNSSRIPFSDYVKEFDFLLLNTLDLVPIIESFAELDVKKICWIHEGSGNSTLYNGRLVRYLSIFDQVCVVGDYANNILRQRIENKVQTSLFLYGIEDMSSLVLPDKTKGKTKIQLAIAGTIDNRKGHDILVNSIEFIPVDIRKRIEILVLGKIVDKGIAMKIRICRDIDFIMKGEVEHQKLLEIMASIDILVCPSRDDPMPIVCTEAMMLSKPLIVSTHTGTSSFIRNGENGFVFNSKSPKELADAIIKAVNNFDLLPEMGRRARQIYEEKFSLEQFDKEVKCLFT